MQGCEEIQDLLMDYVLEDISLRDAKRVQRHIATCDACAQELTELAGTGKALVAVSAMADIEGTEEFNLDTRKLGRVEGRRVMEAVRPRRSGDAARRAAQRARRARGRAGAGSWMIALAAIAALSIAAVILYAEKQRKANEDDVPKVEVAELTDTSGSVETFMASAEDRWSQIPPGQKLMSGETIKVRDGLARLRLEDGSILYMDKGADVMFSSSRDAFQSALILQGGRIYIEVGKNNQGFRVSTSAADVRTLGQAAFGLSYDDDVPALEVTVVRGDVQILGRLGKKGRQVAHARQHCMVTGKTPPSVPKVTDELASKIGWRFAMLSVSELRGLFAGKALRMAGGRVKVTYDATDPRQLDDWKQATGTWRLADRNIAVTGPANLVSRAPFVGDVTVEVKLTPGNAIQGAPVTPGKTLCVDPANAGDLPAGASVRVKLERLSTGSRLLVNGRMKTTLESAPDPAVPAPIEIRLEKGQADIHRIVIEGRPDPAWILDSLSIK